MNRENLQIKGIFVIVVLISATLLGALALTDQSRGSYTYKIKTFSSYEELFKYLSENQNNYNNIGLEMDSTNFLRSPKSYSSESANGASIGMDTVEYSETNIQVEGVDEPDIVKTDGSYLYVLANSKIFIIKGYPPEDSELISNISMDDGINIQNIFLNHNRLIVFGAKYQYPDDLHYEEYNYGIWWGSSSTVIKIFNLNDKENPELIKDIEMDGDYSDARMIDNYVYVISTEYSYDIYYVYENNETFNIPKIVIDSETYNISVDKIHYVDIPESMDTMTHIIAINLDTEIVTGESFLLGNSQNMYVSNKNIFLTYTKNNYIYPLFRAASSNDETTIIHKISIDEGVITYSAQGEVNGHILNQFSMDEYNNFFRIATTIGEVWNTETQSTNNIYVLDDELTLISKIENIAPGEKIYSARFMGDKAYLVTFKKIDPFFTIDLSDPYNPIILGKLKIPGYSDYLQPYDEDHIIGIGKDTVDPTEEEAEGRNFDFAWYQGLKIALFDVSDFENPKEIAKIVIGDRGTDSPALYNHKALLFDREKELLVIPVNLYTISDEIKSQYNNYTGSQYGEFTFQGAYVYNLNLIDGFKEVGRVTHMDDEEFLKTGFYPYGPASIERSIYIDNYLYTISESMVKINTLDNLNDINTIELE